MKVLITGAGGMVARAAIAHCQLSGDEVLAFTRQELDITNSKKVEEIFLRKKPKIVINCAAYTDVDASETNVEKAFAANTDGVENLALAARKIDAAFVTISTDYVFDGLKDGFYTQRDTPDPQGVYAKSKLAGERRAQNAYARSIIVRSGWIFGRTGKNFLSTMGEILANGKPFKVISDSFGTPTFAEDLAARLRELAVLDIPAIYHIANSGDGTSFAGFAQMVCQIKGFDESLMETVSMNTLARPAPRPQNSRLACLLSEKVGLSPLQSWEKALKRFLLGG